MLQQSRICFSKFLLRYSSRFSPERASPILLKSLAQSPTQIGFDSVPFSSHSGSLSDPHHLRCPCRLNPRICLASFRTRRKFSHESGGRSAVEVDVNKEVDNINLKFAEAREEIEMAMESKETVYFDEEAECARDAVKEVLDLFEGLLEKLPEDKKSALQRSMGLKIEQLKAELKQLND